MQSAPTIYTNFKQIPAKTGIRIALLFFVLFGLTSPVFAQVNNWSYNSSDVLSSATYHNITNYADANKNLIINVAGDSQVVFGASGTNFTIYKTSTSGIIVPRTDLASIELRGNNSGAQLQFGGNGIVYAEAGYNGGAGASDAWDFASGKSMITNIDLTLQSGGNATDGVSGAQALNGGKGGAGGNSIFSFNQGTAQFNGVTQFGGNGGDGGNGANSGEGYYATKGGAGGDGGDSTWTVTAGSVVFNNAASWGGNGGDGGLGGQNLSTSACAEHGNGGIGGTAKLTLSNGTVSFNKTAHLGGQGGDSLRGNGGSGGVGRIALSGGKLEFKSSSTLGGQGGNSTYSKAGSGGLGYMEASGGTLIATAPFTWGGTGGNADGVGAAAGTGGESIIYFSGAQVTLTGASDNWNAIGGQGGTSVYAASGSGGKGIVVFSAGTVTANYLQLGGSGGNAGTLNASKAGDGGEANAQFTGGNVSLTHIQFGGQGGNADTSNAAAGKGGSALIYFDSGVNALQNAVFGGNAGYSYNSNNAELVGADGGNAVVNYRGGSTNFNAAIFGGNGGNVYLPNDTLSTTSTGGDGGNGTLNVSGGNALFTNEVILGGNGGSVFLNGTETAAPGSTGGCGGNGTLNINGGMTTFKNALYLGGVGGQGAGAGRGGKGTINVSSGVLRVESALIAGGMAHSDYTGTFINASKRELSYLSNTGAGVVSVTGGALILDKTSLITSFNSNSSFRASGGSILFNIDSSSTTAQPLGAIAMPTIVITGNAHLGVTMDSWRSGKYELDSTQAVLIADTSNALKVDSNSFSSIFYDLETYRGTEDNANKWYLKSVDVKDLDEVWSAAGDNAKSLHNMSLSDDASRDLNNTLFQSRTYDQLNEAADQISGSLYSNALTAPLQRVTSINQIVMTQIMQVNGIYREGFVYNDSLSNVRYLGSDEGILANNRVAPWGGYYGSTATTGFDQSRAGYDYDSNGFIVGLDLPFYTIRLGGYYAFGDSGMSSSSSIAGATQIDGQDHLIGLYMKWNALLFSGYWGISGNYGYSSYDSRRVLPDGAAAASYEGSQWGLYAERGWSVPFWLFNLDPYMALQYESISQDGFNESGSSNLRFSYDSASLKSFRGILGVRGIMNLGVFKLSLGGSYIREMSDCDPFINATAISSGDSITLYGLGGGRDWFNGQAGVTFCLGQFSLMGNYNVMLSGETTVHSGMATIKYKF